ncbi:MAG: sigma-70 family RNA polymerase sigma factor [Candidatus Margulisiibacteriota bacterium]|jgi:RNA polymerase sigma-B factor
MTPDLDQLMDKYEKQHSAKLRNEVVAASSTFLLHIAKRFQYRGEAIDDLTQIGTIGLLKAMDKFSRDRGVKFLTYATQIIIGEIKHYLRDKSQVIRIPRSFQERYSAIQSAIKTMVVDLNRSPTVIEIARKMAIPEETVTECLGAAEAFRSVSLDAPLPTSNSQEKLSLLEAINNSEHDISEIIINREGMKMAMDNLNKKEKKIIYFTYYLNLNQEEVAGRMNFSQAHVSRMLISTLSKLKRALKR